MRINVTVDTSGLELKLKRDAKRLAFSAAQAMNDTALEIQLAERVNLDRKFTVRKQAFFHRLIKVGFASVKKDRAFAEVYIDTTKKGVLLSTFQKGGVKQPRKGRSVAVPITGSPARPSFRNPVTRALTFAQIRLRLHRTASGARQWKGRDRTFLIPNLGVFQRTGGKAKDSTTRLLYRLKPAPLLKAFLDFFTVAHREFNEKFERNFRKRLNSR
jgi:hypothetical protein